MLVYHSGSPTSNHVGFGRWRDLNQVIRENVSGKIVSMVFPVGRYRANIKSGQIIATSDEVTPKSGLVMEIIPLFQ